MPDPGTVTVTLRVEDAYAVALGALQYVLKSQAGEVPEGGSPIRLRNALMAALNTEEQQ